MDPAGGPGGISHLIPSARGGPVNGDAGTGPQDPDEGASSIWTAPKGTGQARRHGIASPRAAGDWSTCRGRREALGRRRRAWALLPGFLLPGDLAITDRRWRVDAGGWRTSSIVAPVRGLGCDTGGALPGRREHRADRAALALVVPVGDHRHEWHEGTGTRPVPHLSANRQRTRHGLLKSSDRPKGHRAAQHLPDSVLGGPLGRSPPICGASLGLAVAAAEEQQPDQNPMAHCFPPTAPLPSYRTVVERNRRASAPWRSSGAGHPAAADPATISAPDVRSRPGPACRRGSPG